MLIFNRRVSASFLSVSVIALVTASTTGAATAETRAPSGALAIQTVSDESGSGAKGAQSGPSNPSTTSAGAEGTDIDSVIITAERAVGAKNAPVKASLDQTQPESIISHTFIEQVTPEVGNISTVVFIAPSVSGISANAGGIGNYFSTTLRGFSDGEYNVTYDGIAFGDTNNPTHHPNDYFPVSTIGAAVVDRGPGAAGDLGQANYGGAIHYFSPAVSDHFSAVQRFTYGTFSTLEGVTTINTGETPYLLGGKLLLNFDERSSKTELSQSNGAAYNQMAKYELPIGDRLLLTAYLSHEWTRYNFPDSNGPGETLQQEQAYGKDFQLTSVANEEHFFGYNYERKQTDFDYLDLKDTIAPKITAENQLYEYFYSNKTHSTDDNSGLIGIDTSAPKIGPKTDIGGYLKRNDYHVGGDVIRFSEQLPFVTLKVGGLVEGSGTYRQKAYYDFTNDDAPVDLYTPAKDPGLSAPTNCKTCERSDWLQEQVFIDVDWRPLPNLTISPGFKYVNFERTINAAEDTLTTATGGSVVGPIHGSNTYDSPLYFITANYKIIPSWSVYGQYATSFLIPQLSELQVPGVSLQHLQPETTTNYQAGTVYTHGRITADADVYLIDAANTNVPCFIADPNGGTDAGSCNAGKVRYSGVEGEAAYALPFGLNLFLNGSINDAKQLAQVADVATGISGNPARELANTPKWTLAAGGLYALGPWHASLTYKQVGDEVVAGAKGGLQLKVPSYDTVNGDVAYNFGRFEIKLAAFNIFNHRQLIDYVPSGSETALYQTNGGFYTYQSGREVDLTLVARY